MSIPSNCHTSGIPDEQTGRMCYIDKVSLWAVSLSGKGGLRENFHLTPNQKKRAPDRHHSHLSIRHRHRRNHQDKPTPQRVQEGLRMNEIKETVPSTPEDTPAVEPVRTNEEAQIRKKERLPRPGIRARQRLQRFRF